MPKAERICLRCFQLEHEHVPGPPSPPLIRGHLGATEDRPAICNRFDQIVEIPPAAVARLNELAAVLRSSTGGAPGEGAEDG